jgi:hypothetical protein
VPEELRKKKDQTEKEKGRTRKERRTRHAVPPWEIL